MYIWKDEINDKRADKLLSTQIRVSLSLRNSLQGVTISLSDKREAVKTGSIFRIQRLVDLQRFPTED